MYKDYFSLKEMPFSIAPDPRFLFMSTRHREAMAHLIYGMQGEGGIVLLTGEVGTGKTTICRNLLEQLPENVDVAYILNPRMNAEELLQSVCEEFHIEVDQNRPGIKSLVDAINARLLATHAQGRSAILIVDEAQQLDSAVLEQLRLLTNLETNTRKLLQIFLIGQPELNDMLARPDMRQVSQRVIARYHLTHLSQDEVDGYVAHRLRFSGASPLIFPATLIKEVYRASGGVPRLINLICDRAMLGAYSLGTSQITRSILKQAVKEVLAAHQKKTNNSVILAGVVTLTLLLIVAVLLGYQFPTEKLNWLKVGHSVAQTSAPVVIFSARPAAPIESLSALPAASNSASSTSIATSIEPIVSIASNPTNTLKIDPEISVATNAVIAANELETTSLTWPANIPIAESETIAFQSLFKLYGLTLDKKSKDTACQQAESKGMRCYIGHGGLTDIVQLDQPILLRLLASDGKEYSATLTALNTQTATLQVAGNTQKVSLMELALSWFGQFTLVWNVPPGFNGKISMSDHGPSVAWLRHAMQAVDGVKDNGSNVFDLALEKRVRSFQLSDGIQPDGQVGPLTIIRLNVLSGNAGPHLIANKKG